MTTDAKLCMSVAEFAERMGVSKPVAFQLVNRADFPALRVGRRILIPVASAERWITEQVESTHVDRC